MRFFTPASTPTSYRPSTFTDAIRTHPAARSNREMSNLCDLWFHEMTCLVESSRTFQSGVRRLLSADLDQSFQDSLRQAYALNEGYRNALEEDLRRFGVPTSGGEAPAMAGLIREAAHQLDRTAAPRVASAAIVGVLRRMSAEMNEACAILAERGSMLGFDAITVSLQKWCAAWQSLAVDLREKDTQMAASAYLADAQPFLLHCEAESLRQA